MTVSVIHVFPPAQWLGFGDELGVPTPVHHVVYAALNLHANGKF